MVEVSGVLTLAWAAMVGLAPVPPAGEGAIGPRDLQLTLERVSDPPYPYQAVRLRLTVRNVSEKRVGPVLVYGGTEVHVKRPGEAGFGSVRAWARDPDLPLGRTAMEHLHREAPLFLNPGEQVSVSFALAAEWETERRLDRGKETAVLRGKPLFPEPGKYVLKCRCGPVPGLAERIEQTVEIEVAAPGGGDKEVLDRMKKDEPLAVAMLQPFVRPDEATVAALKHLTERYPNSSYTDYARFALARGYDRGIGVRPPSQRVGRALAADQLEKVVQRRFDPDTGKPLPNRFAYLPDALMLWRYAEPAAWEDAVRQLNREFPDAPPWLEVVATAVSSADPGQMQRLGLLTDPKVPEGREAVRAFKSDVWQSYRKRAPAEGEEEKRPTP